MARNQRLPETPSPDRDLGDTSDEDKKPLFYCPGKQGFYTPRQGQEPSHTRINAFRNVGRLIGLCLLQNELCPITLNRHVLKTLLGRPIRFHDLAFFDPVVYESLRKLVVDAESGMDLTPLHLTFSIDLCPEEGSENVELIPGGKDVLVTSENVYSYVHSYAQYRMVKTIERAMASIRLGVFDVLPPHTLEGLNAEDLRLLLNGAGEIRTDTLKSVTTFTNESGKSPKLIDRFKRCFWSIVGSMTAQQRQQLLYFWTGSPALPASDGQRDPIPSVTIRPEDDVHLPSANTCVSVLYVPFYPSKSVMREKMLAAIETKDFGFV